MQYLFSIYYVCVCRGYNVPRDNICYESKIELNKYYGKDMYSEKIEGYSFHSCLGENDFEIIFR